MWVNDIDVVRQTLVVFAKLFWDIGGMTKDWGRLAEAVAHRRRELGLSHDAVRQAGGPSGMVISQIESNKKPHPRDDTINKLDAPLRWEPGSAQRVLAGDQPRALAHRANLTKVSIDALLAEIRRRVVGDAPLASSHRVDDGADDWAPGWVDSQ